MPTLMEALPTIPGTPLQVLAQKTHGDRGAIARALEILERLGVVASTGRGAKKLFWKVVA